MPAVFNLCLMILILAFEMVDVAIESTSDCFILHAMRHVRLLSFRFCLSVLDVILVVCVNKNCVRLPFLLG